jgi:S1-C subfamily serine protease
LLTICGLLSLLLMATLLACGRDDGGDAGSREQTTPPTIVADPVSRAAVAAPNLRAPNGMLASPALPSVADVVEVVRPAVVTITVQFRDSDLFSRPIQSVRSGTGLIITNDGYVVTNNHVIAGAGRIRVTTDDGESFEAQVVGVDVGTDLAVLKIEADRTLPRLLFAEPDSIRIGDWVIAIGNALGLRGGPTVTVGVIGAMDRDLQTRQQYLTDLIQTDAAINEGNSGGPLVNLQGEVVGINTLVLRSAQGIGFSVSSFTVIPVVESILRSGRVIWPWIGISGVDVTPALARGEELSTQEGVLIRRVWPASPAEGSGLRDGDVLLALDGAPVATLRSLQRLMREELRVGQEISVEYRRGSRTRSLRLTLEEMPR